MKYNIPEEELKTGDLLVCSSNRLIARLIKKFSKSKWSHTSQVIKVHGEVLLIEAQRRGVEPTDYKTWVSRYNYKYATFRPKQELIGNHSKFAKDALSKCTGRKSNYHVAMLFLQFPLYLMFKKKVWFGSVTAEQALEKNMWNCSTLSG